MNAVITFHFGFNSYKGTIVIGLGYKLNVTDVTCFNSYKGTIVIKKELNIYYKNLSFNSYKGTIVIYHK